MPGWQALYGELSDRLNIVTVALDTDIEQARPFHDAARPAHPSLVDPAHRLVELFGFTNIPYGVWIDERGTIVRGADVAFGPRGDHPAIPDRRPETQEERATRIAAREAREALLPPEERAAREKQRDTARKMLMNVDTTGRYVEAVRDWAEKGAASQYVLTPAEVIERSRPRPVEAGLASAEFELAQHLHRMGHGRDAVAHFKAAHQLDPTNWMYVRQALAVADPAWSDEYGFDMISELGEVGAETFYLPLEL